MTKNIIIIHYNTPKLTDCLVKSINKFVQEAQIYIFDNSDKHPFTSKYDNVTILDNTNGQIIDFDKWLENYPNRLKSYARLNNFASAKHAYCVERCMEIIDGDWFVLLDSDVLLKRDISELYKDDCIYVGEVITQPDGIVKRLAPYMLFINTKLCKENNVHFFDERFMHGLAVGKVGDSFDTGAAFYYAANKFTHGDINTKAWCEHYGHGSWKKYGYNYTKTHEQWLSENWMLWSDKEVKLQPIT